MTAGTERELHDHLIRADRQEDICLATYSPSTGTTRRSALLRTAILPESGEREVHGNASITGEYVLRGAAVARARGDGLVLCHSHPDGKGWQPMSGPDRDAESSFANLARELTGQPLVGMTLAGYDGVWSGRHWDLGVGADVSATECENVRVIGDRLAVSWNDELVPPPSPQAVHARSSACWGPHLHADLTRRSVLVVGTGSVGLDVAVRLAAIGLNTIGLLDFDTVEWHNLDRLVGVTATDAWLRRAKVHVARRLIHENATAANPKVDAWEYSICEPEGLSAALDFDIVFCCVDRPWARTVLNAMAYQDLIPVIDGGIAIDAFPDGGMRGATWRSHVLRPGRPCMACNGQLDLGTVSADIDGSLDDPTYIKGAGRPNPADGGQNVAALSISAAAGLLAQYVSLNVAPGGFGEPGPLQYLLPTHTLEHLVGVSRATCPIETLIAAGDSRPRLSGQHPAATAERDRRARAGRSYQVQAGRVLDNLAWRLRSALTSRGRRSHTHGR